MRPIAPAARLRSRPAVFAEIQSGGVWAGAIFSPMNNIPALITRARAAQLAQRLRLWLALWLARLADLLGDGAPLARLLHGQVNDMLVDLERSMKAALVLLAYARDPWTARRRGARPPFKAPRGFRRHVCRGSVLRHVTRGILGRCDLRTRIARLRLLLAYPDRAVAHIRARIARGLINGRLAICAAARCMTHCLAPTAPTCADTS